MFEIFWNSMPLFVGCLTLVASFVMSPSDVLPVQEKDPILTYEALYASVDPQESEIDKISLDMSVLPNKKTATIADGSVVVAEDKKLNNVDNIESVAVIKPYDESWSYIRSTEKIILVAAKDQKETFEFKKEVTTDPKMIIRQVAESNGCSEDETTMLLEIARRESSFVVDAKSPGGSCVGLFQLSKDKGSYAQRVDPVWNTNTAISYMRDRYGSIQGAYKFRRANNWY